MGNFKKDITSTEIINCNEINLLKQKILDNNKKIEEIKMKELTEQKNFLGILSIIVLCVVITVCIIFMFTKNHEIAISVGIIIGFCFTLFQLIVWPDTIYSKINEIRLKLLESRVDRINERIENIQLRHTEK